MWALLQMIAYTSDGVASSSSFAGRSRDNDAQILVKLFSDLALILPCDACTRSYGKADDETGILRQTVTALCAKTGFQTFSELIYNRYATELVYEVHNRVNQKLASKTAEDLYQTLQLTTSKEAFVAQFLKLDASRQPPLHIVEKRFGIFSIETLNVDSTWILLLAFAQRSGTREQTEEVKLLASVTALCCRKSKSMHLREFAYHVDRACLAVQANNTSTTFYESLLQEYLGFTCGPDCKLSRQSVENRLRMMTSSACTPFSCH
jgi:hypothetical protein